MPRRLREGRAEVFLQIHHVEKAPDAAEGFRLTFSAQPFPGYQARLVRDRPEYGGNWYVWPERRMEGWLCPALFKYFETAPAEIYLQASASKQQR